MASAENSPRLAQTGDKIGPLDKRKEKCPKAKAGTFWEETRKPLFSQGFEGSGQTKTIFAEVGQGRIFVPRLFSCPETIHRLLIFPADSFRKRCNFV